MNEFWKRIGLPLMIPLGALAVIVVVVLNLSRILIGLEENNGPLWVVLFASMVAGAIFFGFTYYSSKGARTVGNSAVLASAGIVIVFSGFAGAEIIQDHAHHEEGEETEELGEPVVTIVATDNNNFTEKAFTIGSGQVIGYENQGAAAHTLLAKGLPSFEKLTISGEGALAKGVVEAEPGEYVFYCDLPGHEASGMAATVTVTAGGAGPAEGAAGGEGTAPAGAVEILSTEEIKFSVTELSVPAGAELTLKNQGALPHSLVIDGAPEFKKLEVAADGETASGPVDVDPGEYTFFCDIPGHREIGMEGTLTVTPKGSAAPAGGAGKEPAPAGGGAGGVLEVISTEEITFEPAEVTAAAGSKITLKNRGALVHNLIIEGAPKFAKLEVAADGETATGTLDLDPGDYVFFCDVPGHRDIGMEGKLSVS